jgi:hypothetical protein
VTQRERGRLGAPQEAPASTAVVTELTPAQRRWLRGPGQPPRAQRRRYGATGHGYKIDGEKVIGVTTAIKGGLPSPALINWAAREVAEYAVDNLQPLSAMTRDAAYDLLCGAANRRRDFAAARGKSVHELARKMLAGEEVDVPEELRGHVENYEKFHRQWRPVDVAVEAVVVNYTHRYAGTLDYLCELNGIPGLSLLDIKTKGRGAYGEDALQLNAYASAEAIILEGLEYPMPEVDRAFVLWVRADGYDLLPVQMGPEVYRFFRCAQQVAVRKDMLSELIDDALPPPAARPQLEVVSS